MSDAKTKGQGERGSAGQHQGATMKNGWQTKNPGALPLRSANGAVPSQPRATPWDPSMHRNQGLKARLNDCHRWVGSGFQPSCICKTVTQGVALGWRRAGALPLRNNPTAALDAESANGAAPYQPGATPQENRTPQNSGLKARANPCAVVSGFQPSWISETVTQGVALGWLVAGALPLRRVCL